MLFLISHYACFRDTDYCFVPLCGAVIPQVFLNEPCKLYTKDLQRGWSHLQAKGPLKDVFPMNRQNPR